MQIGIDVFIFLFSIWCLVLLCVYSWRFWLMYAQQKNIANIKWVMLEVRIPREVFKSPAAMEIALHALLQSGGVGTWYHRNIMGNVPIYSSLEIVSLEGSVHFYVRAQRKFKQLIQNNLYSQYPSIEITEAEDYISKVFFEHRTKNSDVSLWGITWTPTNSFDTGVENPKGKKGDDGKRDNYKIGGDYKMFKTYVDHDLDKNPSEEFKNDPLTPVLEWLGSLGKGEYGWYQILVCDEGNYNNSKFPAHYVLEHEHKHVQLKEIAKLRIAQLRGDKKPEIKFKKGDVVLDDYGRAKTTRDAEGKEIPLTTLVDIYEKYAIKREHEVSIEEKSETESIYRKISKPIVLCVFRTGYLNTKKQGDFVGNIQSTLSIMKQYGQAQYNSFKPRPTDPYDYKWENVDKHRQPWRAEEFYESYVEREGFMPHITPRAGVDKFWDLRFWNRGIGFRKISRIIYDTIFHPFEHPHATDVFALNLEELATFWHLPGQVASTPGIERIDSIKSEAPSNLPM